MKDDVRAGAMIRHYDQPEGEFSNGAPYTRTETDDGRRIRIETDGCGGLTEFYEGQASGVLYGMPIQTARSTRAAVEEIKAHAEVDTTKGQRTQMVIAELARVGWITTRDLAKASGLAPIHVSACLQSLRKRNLAIFAIGKNGHGNKAYIWSLKEAA